MQIFSLFFKKKMEKSFSTNHVRMRFAKKKKENHFKQINCWNFGMEVKIRPARVDFTLHYMDQQVTLCLISRRWPITEPCGTFKPFRFHFDYTFTVIHKECNDLQTLFYHMVTTRKYWTSIKVWPPEFAQKNIYFILNLSNGSY
jgi:hypothetical protein